LGVVGGLAGLGLGVPGIGTIGTAIGTSMDVKDLNEQLGMMGLAPSISFEQALAHNVSLGMLGQSATNQFGQALGFDALAEAPMSAFSTPNLSAPPSFDTASEYTRPMYGSEGYGMDYGQGYAHGGLAKLHAKYAGGGSVSAYDPQAVNQLAKQIEAQYV
jgi:hypothetical protein